MTVEVQYSSQLYCYEDVLRRLRAHLWSSWCLLWLPKLGWVLRVKIIGRTITAYSIRPNFRGDADGCNFELHSLRRTCIAIKCVQCSLVWVNMRDYMYWRIYVLGQLYIVSVYEIIFAKHPSNILKLLRKTSRLLNLFRWFKDYSVY